MKAVLEARGIGPVAIQPGKPGQFDITLDGMLAYARAQTGRFPSEAELNAIGA